jgi:hypothetical protein
MSTVNPMRPLAEFPLGARARIQGLLADIDDTITTEGRLTAAAYAALERLQGAGIKVIPVTGRPAGWCDHIARMWPVDAVVGENGAFWMRYEAKARRLKTVFVGEPPPDRQARIDALAAEILAAVPGCALASDQFCRIADLAIDYCEDVPALPQSAVDAIVRHMEAAGMRAKVSSIHVNGWFGDYDKLSTARRMCPRSSASRWNRRQKGNAGRLSATRPTMRRCSDSFRIRWASPTCWISPAGWT